MRQHIADKIGGETIEGAPIYSVFLFYTSLDYQKDPRLARPTENVDPSGFVTVLTMSKSFNHSQETKKSQGNYTVKSN